MTEDVFTTLLRAEKYRTSLFQRLAPTILHHFTTFTARLLSSVSEAISHRHLHMPCTSHQLHLRLVLQAPSRSHSWSIPILGR
ncbi:hypothetical protein AcV5_003529 [Taiwanofungus camphoratus]|nr:hypothetical protein AcV5_003529 [Antrodia cinnamomea]